MENPTSHRKINWEPLMPKTNKTINERFWEKVKVGPFCWEWHGAKQTDGYGSFTYYGQITTAHRGLLAYTIRADTEWVLRLP
jgi:hypothetical protein